MSVSIVICTRNRADSLRQTLASIGRCSVPADLSAELMVVDNGSTDDTRRVVEDANVPNMPLQYVVEQQAGLARARNRGLAETQGDIILFTDDDVRVPSNWIEGMCRPLACGSADAVGGGVSLPPHLRRRWQIEGFPGYIANSEALVDYCGKPFLGGANMAFRRAVLKKVPGFDPELGAGALGFGEESLFCRQLERAEYRIILQLDVTVEHHFLADRLLPPVVLETARKMGRSAAYIHYHWRHETLASRPWFSLVRKTIALSLRRLFWHGEWKCADVPPYWCLPLVTEAAFLRQYLKERQVDRKYERFGLVKQERRDSSAGNNFPMESRQCPAEF